jgi:hypothetical protein
MCLFAIISPSVAGVLGMLALVVAWLLFRSQRIYARVQKRTSRVPASQPEPADRGHRLGAPEETVQWEVHMHEMARDLSGRLDSKIAVLDQLIRQANLAASRLESALASTHPRVPDGSCGNQSPHTADESGFEASQAEALSPAQKADNPDEWKSSIGQEKQARYREIYTLADYGYQAHDIAHRVGTPLGEVELILGLRSER